MIHAWKPRTYLNLGWLAIVSTRQTDGDAYWYSLTVALPRGLSFNVHLGRPVAELRQR